MELNCRLCSAFTSFVLAKDLFFDFVRAPPEVWYLDPPKHTDQTPTISEAPGVSDLFVFYSWVFLHMPSNFYVIKTLVVEGSKGDEITTTQFYRDYHKTMT